MMLKIKKAQALDQVSPRGLYSVNRSPRLKLPSIKSSPRAMHSARVAEVRPGRGQGGQHSERSSLMTDDPGRASNPLSYFGERGRAACAKLPVLTAVAEGKKLAVAAWLDSGGSADASANGISLLVAASASGRTPVAELLLRRGAHVDGCADDMSGGRTALMVACDLLQPTVVSLLLHWGASQDLRNGKSALGQVREASKSRVLDTLEFAAMLACTRALTSHAAAKKGLQQDNAASKSSDADGDEDVDPLNAKTSEEALKAWSNRQRRQSRELERLLDENERRGVKYKEVLKENYVKGRMLTDTIADARGVDPAEYRVHKAATRLQSVLRGRISRKASKLRMSGLYSSEI